MTVTEKGASTMPGHRPVPPGRSWAYTGAILGGVVSLAANVAHSYIPPRGAPVGWRPELGAVISAAFWPLAVFVAVEILARVHWPTGGRWLAARYLGLLPVAVVAAVVSYRHLSGLLHHYHEGGTTATIGPLAVDGLMVMATAALIATSANPAPHSPVTTGPAEPVNRQASLDTKPALPPVAAPVRTNGHVIGSGVVR